MATSVDLAAATCAGTRAARGGVWGLVAPAVFNTDVAEDLGQAGSIPVRLRHGRPAASQ